MTGNATSETVRSHPLRSEESREGKCTRCHSAGRVWPLEQPAEIVLELDWGYYWLCLDCWRDLGTFFEDQQREPGSERSGMEDNEEA